VNAIVPGDPECSDCHGDGVVLVPMIEVLGAQQIEHPPAYRRCKCVLQKDILNNVERGMAGLTEAPAVPTSKLPAYVSKDLWLTATTPWFKAHLRHTAVRQPPTWYFKVVSDADLITAWLASVALKGQHILDPDAALVSMTHLTLTDLVSPPHLLILRLGVKAARNVATSEVLLETLQIRNHLHLPTWVWDQPGHKLAEGHLCFSPSVEDFLSDWAHLSVAASDSPELDPGAGTPAEGSVAAASAFDFTLSSMGQGKKKKGGAK